MTDKSQLEKALEVYPNFRGKFDDMPCGDNINVERTYQELRTIELAYEQLVSMGHDVSAQLKERRYQIGHLISKVIRDEIEDIQNMFEKRSEYDWKGDSDKAIPSMIDGLEKLKIYLRKLYSNDYRNRETEEKGENWFPEPD